MFGMIFSLQQFVKKISPRPSAEGMQSFRTSAYMLHHFESASGIKLVLLTDKEAGDLRAALRHIYANIYVEFVVRNPLYTPKSRITCDLFSTNLREYVQKLPCAKSGAGAALGAS